MDIDFLFIIMTPGVEVDRYFKLASHIQERGYSVAFLCDSNFIKQRILRQGAEYVFAKQECFPPTNNETKIETLEKRYAIPSLRSLYQPELRYLGIREDQQKMTQITVAHLRAAERFLDRHSVGCIVANQGANLLVRSFYYVGKKRSVPFVFVGFSPIKGKMALYCNEYAHWESLDKAVKEDFSPDELREAEEYIESVKRKRETHIFGRNRIKNIKEKAWVWKLSLQQTFSKESADFNLPNSYAMSARLRSYVPKLTRRNVEQLGKWYFYGKVDLAHDTYLFFPLHYFAESQLTVRAQPYANQEFLIEYIASSLPQGYKLYVKEHPNVLGTFSLGMLRRIKKISNVVLVDPTINPHDLIAHSKAVATINSTAGFEALMHFKPVIVFGQAFYRGYGVTFDVDSLYSLDWLIKKTLESEVAKGEIIRFIAAVRKAVYDGSLNEPECLAESIIRKISGYKAIQGEVFL